MNRRWILLSLIIFVVFGDLLSSSDFAFARMTDVYPTRFSFSGIVELTYKDYTTDSTSSNGRNTKSSYTVLEQRYTLGLKGYIYNRKLAVFTAQVTFEDENTLTSTAAFTPNSKDMTYEFQVIFLPYRPVSLTTYASKTDFTVGGLPGGGSPYDLSVTNYGALLGINLKNIPLIKFEYYHLDITPTGTQANKTPTVNDSFYLNVAGHLNALKTQYSLSCGYSTIQTQSGNIQIKFVDIFAQTDFKRFSLINYFRYYAQAGPETSQLFGIYSNLVFNRGHRFTHEYFYTYEHNEEILNDVSPPLTIKNDKQELRGTFNYKILSNLGSSATLNYGIVNDNDGHFKYYAVNASLNYSRSIKGAYLVSYYRFFLRNDEQFGNFTEHIINLDLSKQLKWGRVYMSYNFTLLDGTFIIRQDTGVANIDGLQPGASRSASG